MKKHHFIILGRAGIIYYSWLLIVLFTTLTLAYESTKAVNWPAICFGIIFLLLVIYTYLTSYWTKMSLKLPFKKKINCQIAPKLCYTWHFFNVYEIKISALQTYYLLGIGKFN